jgi:hypothetical protein
MPPRFFDSLSGQCVHIRCLVGATTLVIAFAFLRFVLFEDVGQFHPGSQKNTTQPFSCNWSPTAKHKECVNLLSSRMKASVGGAEPSFRRWLFFGDSTMSKVFVSPLKKVLLNKSINKACPKDFSCETLIADRCNLNEYFGVPYRPDRRWSLPNYTLGEGPVAFGLNNSYCNDCAGCVSRFFVCTKLNNTRTNKICPDSALTTLRYGGYISMEFARDVEIQSPHYGTSQENIALLFLNTTKWNQDLIRSSFGPTACVIGAGIHDMILPNMTLSVFMHNVKWYLRLLHPTCGHFIWVANTAPRASTQHRYPQSFSRMLEWNAAIRHMLESTPDFMHKSSFLDVFEASISFLHKDNIHMDPSWYRALGEFFVSLITSG